jgi:hypothetical protein
MVHLTNEQRSQAGRIAREGGSVIPTRALSWRQAIAELRRRPGWC